MKSKKGFTLIELIVVIGILGILATGLLAAVDPFEQLKKGRDSSTRGSVVELYNAFIRYYATHGDLPWNNSSLSGGSNTACYDNLTGDFTSQALGTSTDMEACVQALIDDGELKTEFIEALGSTANSVYVDSDSPTDVSVCFPPESLSVYNDDATKYDNAGDVNTNTKGNFGPGDEAFFWCAK